MGNQYGTHSFQRILDRDQEAGRIYVEGDVRNAMLVPFLEPFRGTGSLAVDVGCGSGILTRGLCKIFDQVIGVDQNEDNVRLSRQLAEKAGVSNVDFERSLASQLPFGNDSCDLAVLNGVLEWVGVNRERVSPRLLQLKCLEEALRILRPGGFLYLAIENRWAPSIIRLDPHVRLPLISALPRPLANIVMLIARGQRYQTFVYGERSLIRLLKRAGFENIIAYSALPSYQFPFAFASLESRRQALADLGEVDRGKLHKLYSAARIPNADRDFRRWRRRARMGLLPLLSGSFAMLARKTTKAAGSL